MLRTKIRIRLKRCAEFLLGGLLATGSLQAIANPVTGTLAEDTTWSDTREVEGELIVPDGVTLRIDPGTRVLMRPGASLLVNGRLLADGTEDAPIPFTHSGQGESWERIRFVEAQDSRLRHCVIEYADCEGDHKDYYDDDCDTETPPPTREYHEAVVVLASHVEMEGCTFQHLPDDDSGGEGDAIAVISDDPEHPGPASAEIRNCEFLAIGQGVHTRFAYVLVEDCYFTGHNGDNDDVDLYGESTPPPMIRYNRFLNPNHDDMINPTRCSAVIIGNVIAGSDDHGVVLRDKCSPVMINNLIYDCSSAGIAVQNQCDALLIHNTIVNCGRGVRFFDHTGRWGPPYCLFPGSGRATIVNSIIWDCPTPLELADSPYEDDQGSHVTVRHSVIEGGQSNLSVSEHSTVTWGEGNLEADPLLTENHRLNEGSPCIDAGMEPSLAVTNDLDGLSRPLDGDGDGWSRFDIGAFEYLLSTADSNGDGIPDGWCHGYGLNPLDSEVAGGNPDDDPQTTFQEWVADTGPTDPSSWFQIESVEVGSEVTIVFPSSDVRQYSLYYANQVAGSVEWVEVPDQSNIPGDGQTITLSDLNPGERRYYKVEVKVP